MAYNREGNYKFEIFDLDDDTNVIATTGTHVITFTPPVGFVYEVTDIEYSAQDPASGGASTSGTHRLDVTQTGKVSILFRLVGTFGNAIAVTNAYGFEGDSLENPGNIAQQYERMHSTIILSNSHPAVFTYSNLTDVAQAGTRRLRMSVKIYREAI